MGPIHAYSNLLTFYSGHGRFFCFFGFFCVFITLKTDIDKQSVFKMWQWEIHIRIQGKYCIEMYTMTNLDEIRRTETVPTYLIADY